MYWCDSYGLIELNITKKQAMIGFHLGQCDDGIRHLRTIPTIRRQLIKIDTVKLRECLREYGVWGDDDLLNHDYNLDRILWIACGDIVDNMQ